MSTVKNINGNYTVTTQNAGAMTINTSVLTVNGNLVVTGNTMSINSTNTTIWDNIITLNGGTGPSTTPTQNAGIEVDRGIMANSRVLWNETVKSWQITNDGVTYGNIATNPLQTQLNMNGFAIVDTTRAFIQLNSNVALPMVNAAPLAISGNVVVYAQTPNSGGSGLYVNNGTTTAELATTTAAVKYGIIFG